MFPGVIKYVHHAKFLLNENSTTVLTGVGVVGVLTSAYLTGRSSFKASQFIEHQKRDLEAHEEDFAEVGVETDFTTRQKMRMVWRFYIPPALATTGTIVAIVAANRIASKRIAALVIASGVSERALKEYKERVTEKFGENRARDIRDGIAQDRVDQDPVMNKEVVITGTGEVLCYDMHTGRYFMSSHEKIKQAENHINYELVHYQSASLSEFYDQLGLPATTHSDMVGWDINNHMEVYITTTMSSDNRPCLAIDFSNPPVLDYNRHKY